MGAGHGFVHEAVEVLAGGVAEHEHVGVRERAEVEVPIEKRPVRAVSEEVDAEYRVHKPDEEEEGGRRRKVDLKKEGSRTEAEEAEEKDGERELLYVFVSEGFQG